MAESLLKLELFMDNNLSRYCSCLKYPKANASHNLIVDVETAVPYSTIYTLWLHNIRENHCEMLILMLIRACFCKTLLCWTIKVKYYLYFPSLYFTGSQQPFQLT